VADRWAGLVVDFGGVLTTSIAEAFRSFCESEEIDHDRLQERVGMRGVVHERAEDTVAELESLFGVSLAAEPGAGSIVGEAFR
jgi:hypothetical protein